VNLRKRIALSLALVTLLGLTAPGASAETFSKGTFSLPVQAYWGDTLLPAGDYTLSLNRELTGIDLVMVRGEGMSATILAPAGAAGMSVCSCLKLDDISGTYVIRELGAGVNGREYRFALSKTVHNLTLRGSVSQPVTVPVSSVAGL